MSILGVSIPRTEMVHFSDTPADLTAMVCSVEFPIQTCRTPNRSAVTLTRENVSLDEMLEIGRIAVVYWTVC